VVGNNGNHCEAGHPNRVIDGAVLDDNTALDALPSTGEIDDIFSDVVGLTTNAGPNLGHFSIAEDTGLMSKRDRMLAQQRMREPYPRLNDILNRRTLDRHLAKGFVKAATHPSLPLIVYDYTSLCERRRVWDGVTTVTRGLVRDNKGLVIGRPFQKFFGWQQKSTSAVRSVSFADHWYATEKLDGTMIVAGNYKGMLVLSTRANLDAWQLRNARRLWPSGVIPDPGMTYVLEYVGPDNKIVVPYDTERLILLAVIDNWTGADCDGAYEKLATVFPTPQRFEASSPEQLLNTRHSGLHEGFVLVWPRRNKPSGRLKLKFPEWAKVKEELFAAGRLPRDADLG
jgi:hypothetical protein